MKQACKNVAYQKKKWMYNNIVIVMNHKKIY
jgi:hypothetical protein